MNIKEQIEAAWLRRAEAQEFGKTSGMKYRRAEVEFFAGAMAAIDAMDDTPREPLTLSKKVPPIWVINLFSGNLIVESKA